MKKIGSLFFLCLFIACSNDDGQDTETLSSKNLQFEISFPGDDLPESIEYSLRGVEQGDITTEITYVQTGQKSVEDSEGKQILVIDFPTPPDTATFQTLAETLSLSITFESQTGNVVFPFQLRAFVDGDLIETDAEQLEVGAGERFLGVWFVSSNNRLTKTRTNTDVCIECL